MVRDGVLSVVGLNCFDLMLTCREPSSHKTRCYIDSSRTQTQEKDSLKARAGDVMSEIICARKSQMYTQKPETYWPSDLFIYHHLHVVWMEKESRQVTRMMERHR
jgi:hypothetical protein